jgi:hypothetical protein
MAPKAGALTKAASEEAPHRAPVHASTLRRDRPRWRAGWGGKILRLEVRAQCLRGLAEHRQGIGAQEGARADADRRSARLSTAGFLPPIRVRDRAGGPVGGLIVNVLTGFVGVHRGDRSPIPVPRGLCQSFSAMAKPIGQKFEPRDICFSTVFSEIAMRVEISRCDRPSIRRMTKASCALAGMALIALARRPADRGRSPHPQAMGDRRDGRDAGNPRPHGSDDPRSLDMANDHRTGDLKQIGARIADALDRVEIGKHGIGFWMMSSISSPAGCPGPASFRNAGSWGKMLRRNQRVLSCRSLASSIPEMCAPVIPKFIDVALGTLTVRSVNRRL